jgi:hypothetical protein
MGGKTGKETKTSWLLVLCLLQYGNLCCKLLNPKHANRTVAMTKFRSVCLLEQLIKADFYTALVTFVGNAKLRCDISVTLRSFITVCICLCRNTNLTFSDP